MERVVSKMISQPCKQEKTLLVLTQWSVQLNDSLVHLGLTFQVLN